MLSKKSAPGLVIAQGNDCIFVIEIRFDFIFFT